MRRIKLILVVFAAMTMLLAMSAAPAIANDWNGRNDWNDNHRNDNDWNDNHWNDNWRWHNDGPFIATGFNNDCEWEFEDGWFLGPWGWQWGVWQLDC